MDSDSPEITYRLVVAYHGTIAVGDASRAILGLKGVRRVRFR